MRLKKAIFRLLGKDPEAVVVSFCSGPEDLARQMVQEIRTLVPDRQHFAVADYEIEGVTCIRPDNLPGPLKRKRIGLAPTLFSGEPEYKALRWRAFRMAPGQVLAYNRHLERHHLRLRSWIASVLFVRGVPLDRIWLRPKWLFPFKRDRSRWPETHAVYEGRPLAEGRPRVAILSPYFPFPLSHGGAVRIFNLIREGSRTHDIFLFAFADRNSAPEGTPVLDYAAKVIVFENPRYREPRWASLLPPEVNEFYCEYVRSVLHEFRRKYDLKLLQVEYTQMARYGGDVLVEHDVTFDLYAQIHERQQMLSSWWNLWRWTRFERKVIRSYRRLVAMSEKDAALLGVPNVSVIPNGVDLQRFQPEREPPGANILFVGSFAHFPNVVAFRFFIDEVWPVVSARIPDARFTVIAGKNADLYWKDPVRDLRIALHGFISDLRPFYAAANLVVVPTRVSAGTNLKVIEAMALERAVLSTSSGCAGLNVARGESIWIADTAEEFAHSVELLLGNDSLRRTIALAARAQAELHYDWAQIGLLQARLWRELLSGRNLRVRPGAYGDIQAIIQIQDTASGASHWDAESYFTFDVRVAEVDGSVAGFMVSRNIGGGETEVLNIAVAPEYRRSGVATALLESLDAVEVFLEVRESNEPARRLYRKLGFQAVGRREDYYDDPVEAALVMRRANNKPNQSVAI